MHYLGDARARGAILRREKTMCGRGTREDGIIPIARDDSAEVPSSSTQRRAS